MALWILVDDFQGNANEVLGIVQQELEKRALPGLKFRIGDVTGKKSGWFSREKIQALQIEDRLNRDVVTALPYGTGFAVATRSFWKTTNMAEKEAKGELNWGEELDSALFSETVDRTVKVAVTRFLTARGRAIPSGLKEEVAIFERAAQKMKEE